MAVRIRHSPEKDSRTVNKTAKVSKTELVSKTAKVKKTEPVNRTVSLKTVLAIKAEKMASSLASLKLRRRKTAI